MGVIKKTVITTFSPAPGIKNVLQTIVLSGNHNYLSSVQMLKMFVAYIDIPKTCVRGFERTGPENKDMDYKECNHQDA